MALGILPSQGDRFRLHPVAPRLAPMFCFALLTASCALASLAFACATPFAAFAVVAAAMLPLRAALLVVILAWFAGLVAACEIVRLVDPFGRKGTMSA